MSRPSKFDRAAILDAALEVFAEGGLAGLTAAGVAARLGAPSGSIYYRFSSRDELSAALWLRCVERFQSGYIEKLEQQGSPGDGALAAAQHVLDFVRQHPVEARLLLLYRREDLSSTGAWPESVAGRAAALSRQFERAFTRFSRRLAEEQGCPAHDRRRLRFALVDVPYAAVRRRLPQGPPERSVDGLVRETVSFLLGIDD